MKDKSSKNVQIFLLLDDASWITVNQDQLFSYFFLQYTHFFLAGFHLVFLSIFLFVPPRIIPFSSLYPLPNFLFVVNHRVFLLGDWPLFVVSLHFLLTFVFA